MVFRKTFTPNPNEVSRACQIPLHPDAEEGIRLYNERKYFVAHEMLEDAWHAEGDPERRLYQGILQAGILCMHAEKGNYRGVAKMYARSKVWLRPWPDHCRGLDIGQLKADIEKIVEQVKQLGPDRMDQFDKNLLTRIKRVNQ